MPAPSLTQTPLTKLDGVNIMLLSIGKSPVNTLSVSGITDVNVAQQVLHNSLRDVLGRGWNCNTERRFPLTRDGSGKIAVPASALAVDPSDRNDDLVQRLDTDTIRFYDRTNHTFVLTKDIKVDIKWFLTFEELPATLRSYITVVATRRFQCGQVGSAILNQFTEQDEIIALQLAEQDELDSRDTNFFTSDPTVARMVYRERY